MDILIIIAIKTTQSNNNKILSNTQHYYSSSKYVLFSTNKESTHLGGDLIVFVGPGVGHLIDLILPGDGIFEPFVDH